MQNFQDISAIQRAPIGYREILSIVWVVLLPLLYMQGSFFNLHRDDYPFKWISNLNDSTAKLGAGTPGCEHFILALYLE